MFVKYFIVVILSLYEYVDGDDTNLAGRIIALYGADGAISETLSQIRRASQTRLLVRQKWLAWI
ncbi:MAG: hypothetical protein IJD52_03810 [Alphaproteobacteria bacterium]|nr:hypothetical protein [Alphaproteobacteria bacterium]